MENGVARRASDISGQQKNVIIAEPLARLESDGNVRAVMLQATGAGDARLDLRLMALSMLDYVMEETAFQPGAIAERIVDVGRDWAMRMDPSVDEEAASAVSRRVFDHLRNAAGRFREFQTGYFDPVEGLWRTHSFRYVESLPDPEDTSLTWVRLAAGGKKLLLGMLDVADDLIEDAERAIMAKALERERYQDALAAASRARARSADYRQRIDGFIARARRSWRTIDLAGEVIPVLDVALAHIKERMAEDQGLVARLDDKVCELADPAQRAKAVEFRTALQDCLSIHGGLFRRLASAHADLRATMLRGLRTTGVTDCRDPEADILMPLLTAPMGAVAACADMLATAFSSVEAPRLLDIARLFDEVVAAHAAPEEAGSREDGEMVPLPHVQPLFAPERIDRVTAWLAAATGGRESYRLSDIVGEASAEGFDDASLRLLVLLAIRPLALSPAMRLEMGPQALHFDIGGEWTNGLLGGDDIVFRRAA